MEFDCVSVPTRAGDRHSRITAFMRYCEETDEAGNSCVSEIADGGVGKHYYIQP